MTDTTTDPQKAMQECQFNINRTHRNALLGFLVTLPLLYGGMERLPSKFVPSADTPAAVIAHKAGEEALAGLKSYRFRFPSSPYQLPENVNDLAVAESPLHSLQTLTTQTKNALDASISDLENAVRTSALHPDVLQFQEHQTSNIRFGWSLIGLGLLLNIVNISYFFSRMDRLRDAQKAMRQDTSNPSYQGSF